MIGDPQAAGSGVGTEQGLTAFARYPLIVEGRLVGVLELFSREAISEDHDRAVVRIADQIAAGIERKKVEEALREQRGADCCGIG